MSSTYWFITLAELQVCMLPILVFRKVIADFGRKKEEVRLVIIKKYIYIAELQDSPGLGT